MSDSLTNSQLELACRVGCADAVVEALEEGADINFGGSSPLFVAIAGADRAIVSLLVERGADVSIFEIESKEKDEIVDQLMVLAEESQTGGEKESAEIDGKMLRAFDRMIRNKGLAEPFAKDRAGEYGAFKEGLKWIAAEECHSVVSEFLEMVDMVRGEIGEEGIPGFLDDNVARIDELSKRYADADEAPGDLLKDYLKEQKKLA